MNELTAGPVTVHVGDALSVLRQMPSESVHCVVTSPPYWGLRDYGTAEWEGGDPDCDHRGRDHSRNDTTNGDRGHFSPGTRGSQPAKVVEIPWRDFCGKCGARRVDSQLGLEATPELYVEGMVEVFREVRRVLRRDGTCWLNLGDSYNTAGGLDNRGKYDALGAAKRNPALGRSPGLKPKDLVGIPWRVAFALQADGWWLRSDIVWSKPNPMPESVTDRPTKAHEYLFLLTKAERYYYDADAVREANSPMSRTWGETDQRLHGDSQEAQGGKGLFRVGSVTNGRNLRSVWTIATQPYPEAHFATFPEDLVIPCIKAGTSDHGVCPECGSPWVRVVERVGDVKEEPTDRTKAAFLGRTHRQFSGGFADRDGQTLGWQPTCIHNRPPIPATVLDPFAGSGTTLAVARRLGRRAVGIELQADYLTMIRKRTEEAALPLIESDPFKPEPIRGEQMSLLS